jgi:hypothetical protein
VYFYLHSLGGIAIISDQRKATVCVHHEPMLNISIPAKETYKHPKHRTHNKTERHTHFTNAFNVSMYCRHKSAIQKPIVQHSTLPAVGHDFLVGPYFTVCHVSVFWQSQLFFGTQNSPISYSKFKGCTSSQLLTSFGTNPASNQVIPNQKVWGGGAENKATGARMWSHISTESRNLNSNAPYLHVGHRPTVHHQWQATTITCA